MTKRPRIAILGCSFSAFDYDPNNNNWGYFLAKDNPHVDVVNFAISAHGLDYARFVLNWMVYTNYKPELIIMNIPPLNRRFVWDTKNNHFNITKAEQLYTLIHNEENMYSARPKAPREIYGSQLFYHDDLDENNSAILKDKFSLRNYERHSYNHYMYMMDHWSTALTLDIYESLLGCKIFYYTYTKQDPFESISNMHLRIPPQQYLPKIFQKKQLFLSETDNHLNTEGNEIFYNLYIKNDPNIHTIIRNLK
jgi:hypothetical protein